MAEEKQMHGFRARLDYALKHNYFINKTFRKSMSAYMRAWGCFVPMDDKMIIFSGHTRKYNDSPRAIYEYMIAHPEYKDYKYVWALEDPEHVDVPGPSIKIKADTPEYFKYTLKAKYWITCVNIERSLQYKKKKCVYLNTWHGVAFNCVGNAAGGRNDFDFSHIDLFCYESEYQKEIFKRDMNVREDALIPSGLPRNDSLYHVTKEEVIAIKKKLGLPLDKKILMYAPTWRDSYDKGASYAIKPPMDLKKWEEKLKDKYVLLFRTHAYTTKLLGVEFDDFCLDYTSYPVINDLFKVADILISDYSACIADYSILERPVICFAYDYDDYKSTRGLYIDFAKDMPNGILETEDKVINHILTMDYQKECEKTRDMIKNRFTYLGGHATEMCVEKMFKK